MSQSTRRKDNISVTRWRYSLHGSWWRCRTVINPTWQIVIWKRKTFVYKRSHRDPQKPQTTRYLWQTLEPCHYGYIRGRSLGFSILQASKAMVQRNYNGKWNYLSWKRRGIECIGHLDQYLAGGRGTSFQGYVGKKNKFWQKCPWKYTIYHIV